MDTARCLCPTNTLGERFGVHSGCPFHGFTPADPVRPYKLSENDRQFLKSMRIQVMDTQSIEEVRKADEDRFRRE